MASTSASTSGAGANAMEPLVMFDLDTHIKGIDLPMTFKVKYIGAHEARGLWGIRFTRRPVDLMVAKAKNMPPTQTLPFCDLTVTLDNVDIHVHKGLNKDEGEKYSFPIDTISYGVQDLVYTRVFAMIVIEDDDREDPFVVHAFVCDNRNMARKLTFALAASFQDYSRRLKLEAGPDKMTFRRHRFAIDLRSPEEQQEDSDQETEA